MEIALCIWHLQKLFQVEKKIPFRNSPLAIATYFSFYRPNILYGEDYRFQRRNMFTTLSGVKCIFPLSYNSRFSFFYSKFPNISSHYEWFYLVRCIEDFGLIVESWCNVTYHNARRFRIIIDFYKINNYSKYSFN